MNLLRTTKLQDNFQGIFHSKNLLPIIFYIFQLLFLYHLALNKYKLNLLLLNDYLYLVQVIFQTLEVHFSNLKVKHKFLQVYNKIANKDFYFPLRVYNISQHYYNLQVRNICLQYLNIQNKYFQLKFLILQELELVLKHN